MLEGVGGWLLLAAENTAKNLHHLLEGLGDDEDKGAYEPNDEAYEFGVLQQAVVVADFEDGEHQVAEGDEGGDGASWSCGDGHLQTNEA
eukprot:CAMPEP_0168626960 /NCGR_PEP_ID=MMETSP0449_2-20121227/10948_1 /TAXON_ID=1082188 /ORGANISM="Strombidium rassoulzadegani, Strain ras09" /LENGTH=88 /DNA_ID=CAMNT_0008669065 /DNA_START=95 /DNA_END=361 /DNA_ORIENTATION=+